MFAGHAQIVRAAPKCGKFFAGELVKFAFHLNGDQHREIRCDNLHVTGEFEHLGANGLHVRFRLKFERAVINHRLNVPLADSRENHFVERREILVSGDVNGLDGFRFEFLLAPAFPNLGESQFFQARIDTLSSGRLIDLFNQDNLCGAIKRAVSLKLERLSESELVKDFGENFETRRGDEIYRVFRRGVCRDVFSHLRVDSSKGKTPSVACSYCVRTLSNMN